MKPEIAPEALAEVVSHYPSLGRFVGIRRNGLSINAAACLFETSEGAFFAKRYVSWEPEDLQGEHALIAHLLARAYPTPRLFRNAADESVTWLAGAPYALTALARGEDRYGGVPVFAPFASLAEAQAAGTMLARFHGALADGPHLAPRPFRGLTARYELVRAASLEAGLAEIFSAAPALAPFVQAQPEGRMLFERLEQARSALEGLLPELPRGLLHGDFLKRNLFWEGSHVADVIDFDLWNVGYWVFDLALALLPCGFDWPWLLQGAGAVRGADMRAFLAGYEAERALTAGERQALPTIMESARIEFYLSAIASAQARQDPAGVQQFWNLLRGTIAWFVAHPEWHEHLT